MISFGIKYWFAFLVAAIIASVGVVLLLYFRNKSNKQISSLQLWGLSILRFLSFFIAAFLLLSPFIKNLQKITQNPVIIAAWDNSASLKATVDSAQIVKEFNDSRKTISDQLSGTFAMLQYTFGENSKIAQELNFSEKISDYSELINSVSNNHFNENIGALIIAGDGNYNQGKNPVNLVNEINFPIYTIGFGDTTEIVDSRIQNVRVNRTSFSGNRFPAEVDIQFLKLRGTPLKLSVLYENKELQSVVITPPNQNFFYTQEFILEAGSAGLKHYTVQIEAVLNERNTRNNRMEFVINVLENKQKILILSDGAHPDIGAIKNTLDLQKTYDLSVFTEEPYPSNLSDFNLIVLNQLPSSGKSASEIIQKAEGSRIPILFIVGNRTFIPQLNSLDQGAVIRPLAGSGEEAQPTLNPTYAAFQLSENFKEILPKFPPLQVSFAEYELNANFTPLFYQKIMNIETAKPLIATGSIDGRKTGFIFGEGIWRWRLFDYYQNQSHSNFNELVNQVIQYLALRENEDNFIIDFKPVYAETDDIILTAEVYNDAFERITSEEVNIVMVNDNNQEFNFTFDTQGSSYRLNTGHLPLGDYTFSAKVSIGNETFTETGSFTVVPVNFENIVVQANHNILYQLAEQSGGKFYLPAETNQLINDIENNNKLRTTSYFQEIIRELLSLKWLFLVILFLLSMEWFLRKYWGIY